MTDEEHNRAIVLLEQVEDALNHEGLGLSHKHLLEALKLLLKDYYDRGLY